MRWVSDPDFPFPPAVAKGEQFIFLSDADVWDTPDGCDLAIFLSEYRNPKGYDPQGLSHQGLADALLDGNVRFVALSKIIDHYLTTHRESDALLKRRTRAQPPIDPGELENVKLDRALVGNASLIKALFVAASGILDDFGDFGPVLRTGGTGSYGRGSPIGNMRLAHHAIVEAALR